MKTYINHPVHSTRMRVLSAFLAFLIFTLTFQEALVGWNFGTKVKAATGDITKRGTISATTTESSIKSSLNGQTDTDTTRLKTYTYNGKLKTTTVELFDYFSDNEVGGGGPSQSWNNGYSNPYDTFNTKISNAQVSTGSTHYNADQTITINYKPDPTKFTGTFNAGSVMYARLWHGGGNTAQMSEPGAKMTWDSVNSQFTCTIAPAAYGFTDSNKPNMIYFTTNGTTKTDDITPTISNNHINFEKGNTYTIDQTGTTTTTTSVPKTIIKVHVQGQTGYDAVVRTYIYLWGDGKQNAAFPGQNMGGGYYQYSGNHGQSEYYTYYCSGLDFTPTGCKFSFLNSNDSVSVIGETGDISQTIQSGKTYDFYFWDFYWDNSQLKWSAQSPSIVESNSTEYETTTTTVVDTQITSSSGSSAIDVPTYSSASYTNPLYFGAFYRSNNENGYTTSNKPNGGNDGGPYNNFYWQSHISLKGNTNDYDTDRGHAALQGLVDHTLTGNSASGELQQNSTILPYFNEAWADANSDVMTYYRNDDNAANKRISFPFYEVTIPANGATGYTNPNNSTTDSYAKYYQFNSVYNNLYFEKGTGHSGHFVETSWGDHITGDIQGDDAGHTHNGGKTDNGFFPFNTNSNQNKNYGFGARFDMDFHLNSDGKIAVYDSNGKQVQNAGRVNTRFEFTGDDDLWVFIDGNLVLDLGGAHDKATGYIDFTDRKAVADYAITLGDGNSKDTLYYYKDNNGNNATPEQVINPGELSVHDTFTYDGGNITGWAENGNAFTSLLNGNNTATTYDPSEPHTLTVFYMERGMFDSNLLIRFNFPIEPNFNKMKIREDTNFDVVNNGLKALTMEAAVDDVFMYTVHNKGTNKDNVIDGNSLYPTKKNNTRSGYNLTSTNTQFPTGATESKSYNFQPTNTTDTFAVAGVSYNWVDGFVPNDGMKSDEHVAGITNNSGQLFLMYGTSDVKSSAEFEGQFDRYSTLTVTQNAGNDYLYKPSPQDGREVTFVQSTTRKVGDYYTTETPYIFTRKSTSAGYTGTDVTNGNMNVTNGGSFTFRSDLGSTSNKDAEEAKEVQMTEYFVNTPKTGTLVIEKKVKTPLQDNNNQDQYETGSDDEFTFKLGLTSVFGVSGSAYNVTDYTTIETTKTEADGTTQHTDYRMTNGTAGYGIFTLKAGETLTITGIPVQTSYTVEELNTGDYANPNYNPTFTTSGTLSGTKTDSTQTGTVINTRLTGSLTVAKALGTNYYENAKTNSDSFTMNVTLVAPKGVDLTKYITGLTGYNGYNASTNSTTGKTTYTISFNLSNAVTNNGSTNVHTISGIPYGTTYLVEEDASSQPTGGSVVITDNTSGGTTIQMASAAGTIDESASSVTVTNNYPEVETSLKIREITSFANIPSGASGLLTATHKAADKDVFKYTVSNSGTTAADVHSSGILYPTYDTYIRTVEGQNTQLTGRGPDTDHVYLDTSNLITIGGESKKWNADDAVLVGYVSDGSNNYYVAGEKVGTDLYRFPIKFNVNSAEFTGTSIVFHRYPENTDISSLPAAALTGTLLQSTNTLSSFTGGYTYRITESSGSYTAAQSATTARYGSGESNYNPANGAAVKNTNFIRADQQAALSGTQNDNIDGMTGQTNDTGSFGLMYGTDSAESSAKFIKQFKEGSTMTVTQNGTLETTAVFSTSTGAGTRTLTNYYTTTSVVVKDNNGNGNEVTRSDDTFEFDNANNSTNPSGQPVHLVETFTNTVNVGAIKVTKAIANNETVSDSFTFTLSLTNVMEQSGVNMAVNDYAGIPIKIGNGSWSTLPANGQFTLTAGQTALISGIPVGTTYTITESATTNFTNDGPMSGTVAKGVVVSGQTLDYSNKDTYTAHSDNTGTITNTRKTGSVALSKKLTTVKTSPAVNAGENESFTFTVTLTKPSEVDWNNYTLTFKDQNASALTTPAYTDNGNVRTFVVTVPATGTATVTIGGIPYGTTYSIEEASKTGFTNDTNGRIPSSETTAVNTEAQSFVVTNHRNTHSLTLTKTVSGDNDVLSSARVSSASVFDYVVEFTAPEYVDLADYGLYASLNDLKKSDTTVVVTNTNGKATKYTATIQVSQTGAPGSRTITDIPYNTGYTVTESYTYNGSGGITHTAVASNTSGTITENKTAGYTNSYSRDQTGSVVLKKKLSTVKTSPAVNAGENESFTFTVVLNNTSVNWEDYYGERHLLTISGANDTPVVAYSGTNNSVCTLTISVPANNSDVTIAGIPYTTTYTISETSDTNYTFQQIEKQVGSGNAEVMKDGTNNRTSVPSTKVEYDSVSYTFTNERKQGTLQLLKAKGTNWSATGLTDDAEFTYRVVLTSAANVDLADYLTASYLEGLGATAPTFGTAGNKTTCTFDIGVSYSSPKTIGNLPYGTTYVVTEADKAVNAEQTRTAAGNVYPEYVSFGTPTIPTPSGAITSGADAHTYTITNNYVLNKNSLTLKKVLEGTADAIAAARVIDSGNYTFTVELTAPNDKTWAQLETDGVFTIPASGWTNTNTATATVTVTVNVANGSDNGTATIADLPYGTTFTVSETANTYTNLKQIIGGTVYTKTNSNNTTNDLDIDATAKTASITNRFVQLGSLTVSKALLMPKNDTNGEDAITFPFIVVLSKPANGEELTGITVSPNVIPTAASDSLTYNFNLLKNGNITFSNIPYGTNYTIQENHASGANFPDYYVLDNIKDGANQSVTASMLQTANSNSINSSATSYTFTNKRQTGQLSLGKTVVEKTTGALAHAGNPSLFAYQVELTMPAGVDLRDYLSWSDLTNTIGATVSSPANQTAYDGSSVGSCTFTVGVPTAGKSITNLPYGTTYSVSETYAPDAALYPNIKFTKTAGASNETLDSSSESVSITNTFLEVGAIQLDKTVSAETNSALPSGAATREFTLNVELQAPAGIELNEYVKASALTALGVGTASSDCTYTAKTDSAGGKWVFKLPLADKDSSNANITKLISDVPIGTTYKVTETQPTHTNYIIQVGGVNSSAQTLNVSAASGSVPANQKNVEVTNKYIELGALTLQKNITLNNMSSNPSELTSDPGFTFNVTLTAPTEHQWQEFSLTNLPNGVSMPTDDSTTFTFAVSVSQGSAVTIGNVPLGTGYSVSETDGHSYDATISHSNSGTVSGTLTQSTAQTNNIRTGSAIITNTYTQLGKLKLVKALDNSISGKQGTMNDSSVTIGSGTEFTYKVTLTRPNSSTIDLKDYLSWSYLNTTLGATNVKINGSTIINNSNYSTAYTGVNSVEFTVSVSKNVPKIINDLPYGTTYSVQEINLPTFTDGSCAVDNSPSGTIGTIVSETGKYYTDSGTNYNQATITNSFVQKGSLTVRKKNATAPGSTEPTYKTQVTLRITLQRINSSGESITWTDPSGMTLPAGGELKAVNGEASQRYFDVSVNPDTNVKVLDLIPLGEVKYKVEEVASSATIANYDCTTTYAPSTANTGFTAINASSSTPSVTVTNTYTQHGKLTVRKALSGTDAAKAAADVDDNTRFTYVVTLTAPNSKTWAEMTNLGIAIPTGGSTNGTEMTFTFTANTNGVSVNDSKEITNIPYGTTYEVRETAPSYSSKPYVNYTAPSAVTNQQISSATPEVTLTNAYAINTQTLTLAKALGGTDAAKTAASVGNNTQFTYVVTLTAPDGTNWNTLNTNGIRPTPAGEIQTDTTKLKVTFTANTDGVSVNNPKTITGIPYGTTFEVAEITDKSILGSVKQLTTGPVIKNTSDNSAVTGTDTYKINDTAKTATITNTYVQLGTITLKKKLVADVTGQTNDGEKQTVTFNVQLDAPTTVNWTNYPLKVGETDISGTASDVTDQNTNAVTAKRYTFTVDVPATNTNVTISGIPYGTNYTITEIVPTGYSRVSTYKDSDTTNNLSNITGTIQTGNGTPTYNVTNRRNVQSLTITKTLTGNTDVLTRALGANYNADAHFGVKVTLTSPEHVDLNNYLSETTLKSTYGNDNVIYTARNENTATPITTSKYEIVTTITQASKTLNNVPYGTTCKVEETYSYTGGNGITWTKTEPADVTIDSSNASVTINNKYEEGSKGTIKIKKELTTIKGGSNVNQGEGKSFTFDVTLKNTGVNWETYGNQLTIGGLTGSKSYESVSGTNDKCTFQVTVPAHGEISISGIPDGTTYSISEVADSDYTLKSLDGNTTTLSVTDASINVSTPTEYTHTFVNERKQGTLNLSKTVSGSSPALTAAGISTDASGTPTKFTYHVTLDAPTADVDLADYLSVDVLNSNSVPHVSNAVYHAKDTTATPPVPKSYITFDVTLTGGAGDVKEIANIPYGTTYTVVEADASKAKTSSVTYALYDSSAGNSGSIGEHNKVTVTNSYPDVGTLTLTKTLAAETTDSATPTDFIYQVVLTAPSGLDLETYNYNNAVITLNTGKNFVNGTTGETIASADSYGTYGTNGSTYTFYVLVNANATNGSVVISNIPQNTTYEVTEILTTAQTNAGWVKGIGSYGNTDATDHKHHIVSDNTKNTFNSVNAKTAELVLHEVLLNGTPAHDGDKFTFTVDLVAPEGITFGEGSFTVKDKDGNPLSTDHTVVVSNVVDGVTVEGNKHATITATISHNMDHITIGNLPYGSKYEISGSVNPVAGTTIPENSTWSLVSSEYSSEIPTGEQKRVINAPTQSFTAKNAITGAVKISKTVEAAAGSTLPANARFNFTAGISNVPTGLDLSNFTISTDLAGKNPLTVTNGSISVPVAVTSSNTSTTPAEVIIYGIPQGAEVSISEDAVPSASWENTSDNTSYTITITDGLASTTADFKNTFTSQSITLFKQDAANSAGIKDAKFYLLKLKDTTDITSEAVKTAFASNDISRVNSIYADIVTTVGESVSVDGNTLNHVLTTSEEGLITVLETDVNFTTGDRYFFYEADLTTASVDGVVTPYYMDNTLSPSKIVTIDGTKTAYPITYTNYRRENSTDVELFKTNDSNDPLPGAEFDLYYKENTTPPTYSVNDPYYTPLPTSTNLVSGSKMIPTAHEPTQYDTYTYEYRYKDMPVPSANDIEWIQPRTDNDYIYFRDYNDASTGYIGSQDQKSFTQTNNGGNNNRVASQNNKRSWIFTNFKDNEFGQDQEIDYDHSYWIMAQFTAPGKKMQEYSVWERFVDRYNNSEDTVVWKIQPPDGYTEVRFLLYHDYWVGDREFKSCVRSTNKITFKLGEIYHKTSYGQWKVENYHECYFNAPCKSEGTWSTYKTAANSQTQVKDRRQTGSNTNDLYQADRYTPTQQKIIFHCNSKTVWHNIHIEFFTKTNNGRTPPVEGYYPVGQSAPGYLMEPYAYAGSDYRINGCLTYELTIPAEAEYFRVNNGVASGNQYYYCSNITKLKNYTDRKNYGNYFSINGSNNKQDVIGYVPVTLGSWNGYTNYGDKWYENYTENNVDSDYDYIYFEKPSTWTNNQVYAYFYAGNDLRDDNWQRATYSAWPGVAPVGTEYVENNKTVTIDADGQGTETGQSGAIYHSDVYNYSYTGNLYSDSSTAYFNKVSPETYINNGKIIYKFRIPKSEQKSYTNGEKRNYYNVIFNDGLSTQGGKHETHAIEFKAGYQYYENGSSIKHYDNKPTATYTKRGTGDDYIYIKTTDTDKWDDIHITFYNANGTQILQGGKGYVMDYSGKQTENGTTYSYFRAAIPTNAAQFSINNGLDDSSRITPKYDILRLSTTTEGTDKSDYTKDRLVFALDSIAKTLSLTSPTFKETATVTHHTSGSQSSGQNYTARQSVSGTDDMLYIRNTAGWTMGIGGAQVKFYDENGTQIGTAGTYTLIMSNTESEAEATANGYTTAKEWYSIPIPVDAVSFTVTYANGTKTTGRTAIYPSGDTNSRNGNYTTGNMYYETESGGTLSVISSTVTHPGAYTDPIYSPIHTRNGDGTDYLYLVCADKNDWQNMTVTFKDAADSTIKFTDANDDEYSSFPVQYLNEIKAAPAGENPISGETSDDPNAVGHWYKVAIPEGAKAFTVTGTNSSSVSHSTSSAVIYDLAKKYSRYKKDYTLGDMQYRLPDSGASPTLLYPVYTEIEGIAMDVGNDSVSGTGTIKADATAIAQYETANPATAPSYTANEPNNPYPVLYNTQTNVSGTYSTGDINSNNVSKSWSIDNIYFKNDQSWTSVVCTFYNGTTQVSTQTKTGSGVLSFSIPEETVTKVVFSNNGSDPVEFALTSGASSAANKICEYRQNSSSQDWTTLNRIYFEKPSGDYWIDDNTSISIQWNSTQIQLKKANGTESGWKDVSYINPNTNNVRYKSNNSVISSGIWYYDIDLSAGWTQVQFRDKDDGTYNYNNGVYYRGYTEYKPLINCDGSDLGKANYFKIRTSKYYAGNNGRAINYLNDAAIVEQYATVTTYSWQLVNYDSGTATTYTATYQPEDRYGLITNLNGTYGGSDDDKDNYIYLNTTITNPYVMFYTGASGSGTQIGGVSGTTTTVGIKADNVGTNLYRVRLPRAAQSFVVTSGAVANPITTAYNLYETGVQHTVVTGGDAQTYTLDGTYHHAGTTFTVDTTGAVTGYTLRDGFTPNRDTTLTDPLNPRSDSDYVFFTDTNGTFANSNTVYAYFYGGADGEFTAWPGLKATTATGNNAATTYTDNYGRTVYMFRIPKNSEGTYPYVIFNNGSNSITQAQEVVGGNNYILDTDTENDKTYGTFDANAQAATAKDRTTETSGITYSTAGTNRYIYIVNNGTQNLKVANDTPALDTGRFTLDDMHIVFYDENKRPIGVGGGTDYAGYKPDRLLDVNYTEKNAENQIISGPYDVYRIQVPAGAKYFQINNGEREETGSTATQMQFNERQSELKAIAANGLYKFVQGETAPQKYIEATDTMPTGNDATRQVPHYLLTLVNEVKTDEDIPETDTYYVKLATVVTKDSRNGSPEKGNIDYIKWLKLNDEGTQVDQNYLDHTLNDIYHPATSTTEASGTKVTQVRVVKKGTYYWIEKVAPAGYEQNEDRQDFVVQKVTNGNDVKVFTYNDKNKLEEAIPENTVTVINIPLSGEVVLTKVSKEKVGTTDIGSVLPGAKFKLIKIKDNGDDDDTLRFSKNSSVTDTNEYSLGSSSAAYNTTDSWLETGADGKLTIKGLLPGDYYLEEQEGAKGYSHLNHHTGEAQRVYFSTGSNTIKKEITLADEMAPAYIRLFEHISERRESEWGNPTFVFKIKQTQYYKWMPSETEGQPDEWKLNGTDDPNGKEILVALTVNDDGKIIDSTSKVLKWIDSSEEDQNNRNKFFDADPIDNAKYGDWLVEATSESEYNGMFRIDEQGRIRVEPGKYEITRLPVSRYEFVTSGHIVYDTDPTTDPYLGKFTEDGTQKVAIDELEAGKTADVHYYDKVGYYDKFTQVDEEINKFYKLGDGENGTTAGENLTVKGIRIDDYSVDTDDTTTNHDTLDTAADTLTVAVTQPTRFKAYWIMADGSEKQITDTNELAKLVISYKYDENSGDDEHFGNQSNESDNDFSYNTTSDVITVKNYAARYKNGVYTLKATYDGKYSANFDIVFERAS